MTDIAVLGQVGRDVVLGVDRLPDAGHATPVHRRAELLGGKGANQAVGCRQLGASVALVGVVGADEPGRAVLAQAEGDGIDTSAVVRRDGAATALLVDVVEADGSRYLLEHVPTEVLLSPADVRAAAEVLGAAEVAMLQLQQPAPAILEAARLARRAGVRVVADGGTEDPEVREALRDAWVVRADAVEAAMLVGRPLTGLAEVAEAARQLCDEGADVVALAAGGEGNVVVWADGEVAMPLLGGEPVDPTGAGDAFVSALTVALLVGRDPLDAAWWASAAAASTASRLGGRPALTVDELEDLAQRARAAGSGRS